MQKPKLKIDELGNRFWILDGKLHREDGPAYEGYNGSKAWRINDKLHRDNGAAIEWSDGTKSWYLDGKEYREEEWELIKIRRC